MPVAWTLQRSTGETRSLEDWGISRATCRFISFGVDTLDLVFGKQDLLGNLPFDDDETLVLLRAGVTFFRGRVTGEKRGAYGSREGAVLTVSGPWWYLEKIVWQSGYLFGVDPHANPFPSGSNTTLTKDDFTFATSLVSRTIIGGTSSSNQVIANAIAYAIGRGAPIQSGTIDAGLSFPAMQIQDVVCSDIIRKVMRWMPDQTAWWDYSQNPPALNIRARANRPLVSLDVSDALMAEVEINPRRDLILSGVTINYVRTQQRANFAYPTIEKDQAGPDPIGIGALVVTFPLTGSYVLHNVPGDPYSFTVVEQDNIPAGLAASIYNAFKNPLYGGRIVLVADDFDATPWIAKTLRILHGAPAWATAIIDVQAVEYEIPGRTAITVGPAQQINGRDIASLIGEIGGHEVPTPTVLLGNGGTPSNPDIPPDTDDPRVKFPNAEVILKSYWWGGGFGGGGLQNVGNYDSLEIWDATGVSEALLDTYRAIDLGGENTLHGVNVASMSVSDPAGALYGTPGTVYKVRLLPGGLHDVTHVP
jgi:hypothetical protein